MLTPYHPDENESQEFLSLPNTPFILDNNSNKSKDKIDVLNRVASINSSNPLNQRNSSGSINRGRKNDN
jgi:hypothetical protein